MLSGNVKREVTPSQPQAVDVVHEASFFGVVEVVVVFSFIVLFVDESFFFSKLSISTFFNKMIISTFFNNMIISTSNYVTPMHTRRIRPTKLMNWEDVVAKFVRCDKQIQLVVA